jgi:DNA-binding response OmpR family regulator
MSNPFKVFVVDDDPIILEVIRGIVEADHAVETFASAEACMARLQVDKPDMFLLDVGLPGMDGYAFCRWIKDDAGLCQIPVTFVSGRDTIEARIDGYDAGGEDFVVKPFEPEELLRKIRIAQHIAQNQQTLREQADASEYLATLALASMDEAGIVLQFMSKLIGWNSEREVAEGLLELMQRYRLDGVVQARTAQRSLTLSKSGTDLPLETAVINHVRGMDRIFEFRTRSVHNFDRVTLMVSNMPLNDPDFCGRIRDNLSVAAQGADSRLQAIETESANRKNQEGILAVLQSMRESIGAMRQAHLQDRAASNALMLTLDQDLANSFIHLGMSDTQERQMEGLIDNFMKSLVELLDRGEDAQKTLQQLSEKLGQLQS